MTQRTAVSEEDAAIATEIDRRLTAGDFGAHDSERAQIAELGVAMLTESSKRRAEICTKYGIGLPATELRKRFKRSVVLPEDVELSFELISHHLVLERRTSKSRGGGRRQSATTRSFGPAREPFKPKPRHGGPKRTGPKAGPKKNAQTR